jgi:signal transduction histidine kinase
VDGALAGGGTLNAAARQSFAGAAASRQLLMNEVVTLLPPSMSAVYAAIQDSAQYRLFHAIENEVASNPGGGPVPVDASTWQQPLQGYLNSMLAAELKSGMQLAGLAASISDRSLTEALATGGVGLVAVVASILLLVWFGRKLTRDLGDLHGSVRAMAEERLPRVVERLRRGDDVDVHAESPPPAASDIQEISQIAASFAIVQEAAVAAAVDQARLRKGVSQVFLNISMRNQSLLHRQLGMLDSMERGTSEPSALADLFRLDHLTTRMRRHAEGLIILSGSTPARGWRNPVPIVDVLRAAVAEVEDYVRVDVVSESLDLITGNAVNDAIHLFAELIENATVFSPPNTRVEVRADRVGTGLAVEIEDRGLGLAEDELAEINSRIASPAEFDLANSEQLGLFVVSRLAARHAITITLRRSVYGGTTAILLLPFGLIVRAEHPHSQGHRHETDALLDGAVALSAPGGRYHRPPEPEPEREPEPASATPRPADADVSRSTEGQQRLSPTPMTPWPEAFQPRTAQREAPGRSHLGMPVRVPQANLVPQLRATGPQPATPETPDISVRSPEATRDMLVSMQHGWERGRLDDLGEPEDAPDNGTGR